MNTFLIIGLGVVIAWLVLLVCVQAGTIRRHQELEAVRANTIASYEELRAVMLDRANLQVTVLQFQEQRYHLMWDVRRLHEQQIFALQASCNHMSAFIKAHHPGQRPGQDDPADSWKPPGWKPNEE